MRSLPRLRRRMPKWESEVMAMGGLNYSDNIRPGDLADSCGISARRWPYITTRWAYEQQLPPGDTTSLFNWDGHRVRVTGGLLYYDGKAVENVSPGPKQFVVVNTRLIVWPDKLVIDVTNGTAGRLDAHVLADTAAFTGDTLTANLSKRVAENILPKVYQGGAGVINPGTLTYGKDPGAIKWTPGGWELPVPTKSTFYTPGVIGRLIEVGDILIPAKSGNSFSYVTVDNFGFEDVDTSLYNQEGFYCVVTKVDITGEEESLRASIYGDVYKVNASAPLLSASFTSGDAVTITGTIGGYHDVEQAIIKEVMPGSLKFPEATFRLYRLYGEIQDDFGGGNYSLRESDSVYWNFSSTAPMKKGWFLFQQAEAMTVWDPMKKEVVVTYPCKSGETYSGKVIPGTLYTTDVMVRIDRSVPDMDFICEKDNRLWGCSSKDRTIYASSLGLPQRFYEYAGTAADSVAILVGSEGAFTACCKYGSAVLFFKENAIIKILGDFPPQYSAYTDQVEGVQAGSHKSIQTISGVLYYLGVHGVFSYTGGAPVLISPNFGLRAFSDGVSGTDGDTYYLAVKEGSKRHLFAWEPMHRIWVREESLYALDFSRSGRQLLMLQEDGSVQDITSGQEDKFTEWMAQFCPFWDTLEGRKTHSRLTIRMELPKGSYLAVKVRSDSGQWEEVKRLHGVDDAVSFSVPPLRSDKFEIRLEGRGPCAIMGLRRRFQIGSDK